MAPRSAYAGGYSEGIRRQLDSVVIPDKIKCAVCKKIRMQSAFSKRQIDVLRNAIVTEGAKALSGRGHARCRYCVSGQTVELRCSVCDKTKGLEEFARNQRNNRDTARCLACVQRHVETDPVIEEQKLLVENVRHTGDTFKLTSQIERTAVDLQKLSLESSTIDDDDLSVGGGVWVEPGHGIRDDESTTTKGENKSIGLGGPLQNTSLTNWGGDAQDSFLSMSPRRRSPPPKKESRFARVPASYVDDEEPRIRIPEREEEDVGVPSDEEEEEDDIETFL